MGGSVFGGSGGPPRSSSPFPGAAGEGERERGRNQETFLEFDNLSGEMVVHLPPRFAKYQQDLFEDLYHEFRFENPDGDMIDNMNEYIQNWLREREEEAE